MVEECKKCGNVAEGDTFTFYHGLKTGETVRKVGATSKHRIITESYSDITATSFFLCNDCVKRRVRQRLLIGLVGGAILALLGVLAYATTIPAMLGETGDLVQAWAWCCFPISLFLIVAGLISLRRRITAENMAIEIGKKEIKLSDTFWNSDEYKKLTRAGPSLPRQQDYQPRHVRSIRLAERDKEEEDRKSQELEEKLMPSDQLKASYIEAVNTQNHTRLSELLDAIVLCESCNKGIRVQSARQQDSSLVCPYCGAKWVSGDDLAPGN